jgi:hypothetical protein
VEAPVAPAAEPTLLSDATPPAEPVVEVPAEPVAPAVTEPAAEPLPVEEAPPSYNFAWPEGFTAPSNDDPTFSSFVGILGANKVTPEAAQELANLHAAEVKRINDGLVQRQFDVFAETVRGWEKEFREDPEFKNRVDTTLNDARWAIKQFGGTDKQVEELRNVLLTSGVGNHRALIRAFSNMAKQFKEARPGPRPAPPTARSGDPAERRYGTTMRTEQ